MQEGARDTDAPFRVFESNWQTLMVFSEIWHSNGLDWRQAESVLNLSGIERARWPGIFEGLRAAKHEALKNQDRE